MSTTAKDLIQRAVARSTRNDPDKTASRKELIRALSDFIRPLYVAVAEVDEEFFPTESDVTGSSGVWALPSTMIAPFYVEDADGVEVSIVPLTDRDADIAPRVYQQGTSLYTVGETGDPAGSEVLTIIGSFLHSALDPDEAWDHADNTLSSTWPERHNDLLVSVLARYLAVKREDAAEIAELAEEVKAGKALLLAEAELRARARVMR